MKRLISWAGHDTRKQTIIHRFSVCYGVSVDLTEISKFIFYDVLFMLSMKEEWLESPVQQSDVLFI